MTAVSVPETVLLLAAAGLATLLVRRDRARREVVGLFGLSQAAIVGMAMLPGAVLHDVTRLLLPALPFLAGTAAAGGHAVVRWVEARGTTWPALGGIRRRRLKAWVALVALAVGVPAAELVAYHPFELSYHNRLIGGLAGAHRRGLDVTAMMEAFTPRFLETLNGALPPGAVVNASFGNFMFRYYQRQGRLRTDIRITDGPDFDYYILLNRRSGYRRDPGLGVYDPALFPEDRAFLALRPRVDSVVSLYGVPLIWVFTPGGDRPRPSLSTALMSGSAGEGRR
jgi:hypothetical protein